MYLYIYIYNNIYIYIYIYIIMYIYIYIYINTYKYIYNVNIEKASQCLSVQLSSKYLSKFHINMSTYVGAIIVPIAFPSVCCRIHR